jgi:hypothetical protein
MRHIKALFIRFWVWLTPQAAKHKIQSDFMRQMVSSPPRFGQLTQPLLRRIFPGEALRGLIQVEPLPPAARMVYDPDPVNKEEP